jgi:ribosomal protein L12E/L44/L45/RPP1/RPP2|mmetsp:Transcript_16097/g.28633  ORF Transcript_16097/g.28633 Transcript_16097/m.28633 type:complete len:91 (-) Transcript_16097:1380-1652(-)
MASAPVSASDLTAEQHREQVRELVTAAGLDIRQETLDTLLQLLALGATPSAIANVLRTLANQRTAAPTPGATPSRRSAVTPAARQRISEN